MSTNTQTRDDPEGQYLYERAETELKRAQESDHPAAVKAHYLLAGYYLDRLYGELEGEHNDLTPQ